MSRGARVRGQAQAGHPPVSQPPAAHLPVLYAQVLSGLRVIEDGTYLDGTFGRGGHARGVLEQLGPQGRLLVMDKDPEAIAVAQRDFAPDARVSIHRGSFADLLDWNETAIGFYQSLGAIPLGDWTTFRITGDALQRLSGNAG